jgi:Fe-S-cluster containining protein
MTVAALLLADAPAPSRPLDHGASCPWQDVRGLCTARDARPLGCRVYFCDVPDQDHLHALGETFIARLKRLADDLHLPWDYAPLHRHLHAAHDQGRYPSPVPEPRA